MVVVGMVVVMVVVVVVKPLRGRVFTTQSDVWSFLWQFVTMGK